MPIVRPYPISEVLPQRIPDDAQNVPAAGEVALFGGNRASDLSSPARTSARCERHAARALPAPRAGSQRHPRTGLHQPVLTRAHGRPCSRGRTPMASSEGADAITAPMP